MKLSKLIKTTFHGIRIFLNPEKHFNSLMYIGDRINESKASRTSAKKLMKIKKVRQMYSKKVGLDQITIGKLRSYSKGSLGNALYHFYTKNDLTILPMKSAENLSQESYITERIRRSHDMLHVMLGFDIDLVGEAQVNAFVANQTRMPLSIFIMVGVAIRYFIKFPSRFGLLINEVIKGWKLADSYNNFLEVDWDLKLDMPLQQVLASYRKDSIYSFA